MSNRNRSPRLLYIRILYTAALKAGINMAEREAASELKKSLSTGTNLFSMNTNHFLRVRTFSIFLVKIPAKSQVT
jgi:hypothetical protein